MSFQIEISWSNPRDEFCDCIDLLYEVSREVRDSRIGQEMDALHKRGGTLTLELVQSWEYRLRDMADRVHEIRSELLQVGDVT
jgi:hypothetical protein